MHILRVDVPNSNTTIIQTPILDWYVVKCGSKNRHQKDMCSKYIGSLAQNMLTILGSKVNMIVGTCMIT